MNIKEIEERYKDEWVLVTCKDVDENFDIIDGDVLYRSKDKDEVYKKLLELKPKNCAIEYTGKVPEDLAVML
ncbi:MAG: hypothetical protein ABH870_02115 [bacterium]